MAKVTPHIETHLRANMNMRKRDILISNFLGGLSWGVGSVIGATIVVAIILKILSFVPFVNNLTSQLTHLPITQIKQSK